MPASALTDTVEALFNCFYRSFCFLTYCLGCLFVYFRGCFLFRKYLFFFFVHIFMVTNYN